ncbi:erythromycin esterase family protein [Amycolatopsis sp. QT-25]|uniref:erythromycin esterase family protein n=1 Tax=Amycolatopsis sp. QT-25 TaxID=3034022 RepID=UPI0023ED359D|nr:erythromycin esterase family protein [Amycolatopsis sp. QT-25]WET81040.1 erythromycin esterase family protein [Amycolatopsis sp. QT-25]
MAKRRVNRDAVSSWLAESAIVLRALEPKGDLDDLTPFATVLEGVQVVGLGEATHGSKEFFTLKHRLIEFLVRELDFTVIAFEAGRSVCRAVNDYIQSGEGTASAALTGVGYWTWDTYEVLALVEWLREYNASMPAQRRVRFHGIDSGIDEGAVQLVAKYLDTVVPHRTEAFREAIRTTNMGESSAGIGGLVGGSIAGTVRRLFRRKAAAGSVSPHTASRVLLDTAEFLRTERAGLVEASSVRDWSEAVESATELANAADIAAYPLLSADGCAVRDRYLADAVRELADDGERVAVWAHNGHVARSTVSRGVASMGAHLSEVYGSAYYALGLTFNQGSFQASRAGFAGNTGLAEFTVEPAVRRSVEALLAQPGIGDYLIDFRAARYKEPVMNWLTTPAPTRSYGAIVGFWPMVKKVTGSVTLADEYDGLAFIERTTRARSCALGGAW